MMYSTANAQTGETTYETYSAFTSQGTVAVEGGATSSSPRFRFNLYKRLFSPSKPIEFQSGTYTGSGNASALQALQRAFKYLSIDSAASIIEYTNQRSINWESMVTILEAAPNEIDLKEARLELLTDQEAGTSMLYLVLVLKDESKAASSSQFRAFIDSTILEIPQEDMRNYYISVE